MKRITATVMAAVIAMISLPGCYGKMALTRKVYNLNGEVSDKYLRSFVTWIFVLAPVYAASMLADFILFNTIEFWSGRNPIAQGEKDFQYADGGKLYKVHAVKAGDTVTYRVDRYLAGSYLDTLAIDWDLKSGNSVVTLHEPGKTTSFAAVQDKGGVKVTSSNPGGWNGMATAALAPM